MNGITKFAAETKNNELHPTATANLDPVIHGIATSHGSMHAKMLDPLLLHAPDWIRLYRNTIMLTGIEVTRAAIGKVYPVICDNVVAPGEELMTWTIVELAGISYAIPPRIDTKIKRNVMVDTLVPTVL